MNSLKRMLRRRKYLLSGHCSQFVRKWDMKCGKWIAAIEEEVYLEQPEGYEKRNVDGNMLYCRLRKTIYGRCQAGRNWNSLLNKYMKSTEFVKSESDQCLFVRRSGDSVTYVAIWVDDIIVCGSQVEEVKRFQTDLGTRLKITECRPLEWILGMHVVQSKHELIVHQSVYVKALL